MEEKFAIFFGHLFLSVGFFFFLGWLKKSIDFLAMLVDLVLVCSSNFVPLFLLWEIRWAYHTINWGQAIFAWGMQTWNHSEKWCESSWSECPPETHQVAGPKSQILDCTLWFGKTNPTGWMYVQAFRFLLATEWGQPNLELELPMNFSIEKGPWNQVLNIWTQEECEK
jgi:hypothetical protein